MVVAPKEKSQTSSKKKIEREPLLDIDFNDTSEISVPPRLIDQVIGQDEAVEVIKKAALQRRHVLLIGEPGIGKSMLGQAMAELLPKEELVDILCLPNLKYPHQPKIAILPAGHGAKKVEMDALQARKSIQKRNTISFLIVIAILAYALIATMKYPQQQPIVLLLSLFVAMFIFFMLNQVRVKTEVLIPKLLVDNGNKDKAPFNDATGSHAGALFGDVRHDPFQSSIGSNTIVVYRDHSYNQTTISDLVDNLLIEKSNEVKRLERNNYEAVFLKSGELKVLTDRNGIPAFVDILSVNRYDYDGKLVKVTTIDGNTLILSPDHKIAVIDKNDGYKYVPAKDLRVDDELIGISPIILDEDDIINTYSENLQRQSKLFRRFLKLREHHPTWGYKRLSKSLGFKGSKFRWWYTHKHSPKPIQTVEKLKDLGLLPLTHDNPKLPIIARVLGALFGDGGIFSNLNGIFLSSKERDAVEEFGEDLIKIFGDEIRGNYRIIEGGEKGHSWSYQNTNRTVIRFFLALGAPLGNKTKIDLHVPAWLYTDSRLLEEFFGSYLGSELGVPKVHKKGRFLNTLDVAISADLNKIDNRKQFLKDLADYLKTKGVKHTSIVTRPLSDNKVLVRLLISTKYENILNFVNNVKINYCRYKKQKIEQTLKEFTSIKYEHYKELIGNGMGAESAMKRLNLTPRDLYHIISQMEGQET